MIYLLTLMVIITAVYFIGTAVYGHFKGDSRELKNTKVKLQIARSSLRHIAGDLSGNPTLDAQLALEEIETYEIKELN